MKARIEITQAVWERTTAYVEIPDNELDEDYGTDPTGVEMYLLERMDDWMDTADTQFIGIVENIDTEYSTVIIEE